jgi:hypothetical protein
MNASGRLRTILGALGLLLTIACSREDDVLLINALVDKGAAQAEVHDVRGLMKNVTADFIAQPGKHGRSETSAILLTAFRYYGPLKILHPRPIVDLDPSKKKASATIYFMITKKELAFPGLEELFQSPSAWLAMAGKNADLYSLKLTLKKINGTWFADSAKLEPFRGIGFER